MSYAGISSVLRLEETDSTQTVARFLAEEGASAGTLVWAKRQSRGRGRLKRRWDSPDGGLYVSLILRPSFAPERLAELSLAAARAAAAAIKGCSGLPVSVKPPNDVYAAPPGGRVPAKKICGILAEASGGARRVDWLVLGVGINVNNRPPLVRAASLKSLTGKSWEVEAVLRLFLSEFDRTYRRMNP